MSLTAPVSSSLENRGAFLLSVAALFEGDFSIDWIVELTRERATAVLRILEAHCRMGWCRNREPGVFVFVDPKKKQELQELLCAEEREHLHRRIAELLKMELADEGQKSRTIAHHLLRTTNDVESSRWLVEAGDLYRRTFENERALQCYTKVLEDLSALSGEEADQVFVDAAINYSKISIYRHNTGKVISILQDALERARKWNKKACQSLLEMHLAANEWLCSRYPEAMGHFRIGWSLSKEIDDLKILRSITAFGNFFLYWQGRFAEAVRSYEKSVPEVDKFPHSRFPLMAALVIGQCYGYGGQITQGLGMLDAIRVHCLEKGDVSLVAHAEGTIGDLLLNIRRTEEAVPYLKSALEKASEENNRFLQILLHLTLASAHYFLGNHKRSMKYLERFLERRQQVEMTVQLYPYLIELCWGMEQGILPRISGLSLREEVGRSLESDNVFMKGVAFRYLALLQRREGAPQERMLQSLAQSLEWLEMSGHQIELAKSQMELARQHVLAGEEGKAQETAQVPYKFLSSLNEALIPDDLRCLMNPETGSEELLKEILKLNQEVVTIRQNKDLVQYIISTGNKMTGAERGAIFLFGEKSNSPRLGLRASKNLTTDQIRQPSFLSSMAMIEEVAATGRGLIQGTDTKEIEAYCGDAIRSRICVPMILRDRVLGVLYHDNRLLGSAFNESDLEMLAYFGALAALALDNAEAYEEIHRLNQKLNDENKYYEEQQKQTSHSENIVGHSPSIMRVLDQIAQVAPTESNVLVLGETGVGKELVAMAIHQQSPRRGKPFIRVHCSALPESLIPSELFGHEKGAFTGATQRRIGRFELADGGTLFLDEIGDLSPDLQVQLLRVLQSKEFERVGGSETRHSDFRLVAATNRDLEHLVMTERYRADLFYRLNVFPIHVPPLRERKEDIPSLAYYFLKNYARKTGKPLEKIPESEMDKLTRYQWPGNVRELENVIERGTILSAPPYFHVPTLEFSPSGMSPPRIGTTLLENERQHILWALGKTNWKVRGGGGCSELLDIPPSTLESRMKKLGIQRPPRRGASSG
jgi:formate hydrogenlyase transcriptional activator